MRAPGSASLTIASLAVALAAGACNKGAAQDSLRVAEESFDGARADLEALAPGEFRELGEILEVAHADLEEGRYTDALRAAQGFPARVRSAQANAERRRRELLSVWDQQSLRVPPRMNRFRRQIALLSESSPATAAARSALGEIHVAWSEAQRARREGHLARAVAVADGVEARLQTLSQRLGPLPSPRAMTTAEESGVP